MWILKAFLTGPDTSMSHPVLPQSFQFLEEEERPF
jgi:hypothetical protein